MASTGVNVLRWGALAFGVFYGFTHQTAISSRDKIAAEKHEYERKEKLISDAKAAWAKKNAPPGQGSGLITDPNDPKFDLEAFLTQVQKDNP
ncbi:hypothetical protein WHR41_08933 [Cladosporium halotolerans]|uniref:ATP synthase F(0) complex subunit e, mitochondrial n=1 Tax=Cladosporium halotolerans TaxID=1052096 RepID=A0AB34KHE9_9PEZI